MTFPGKIFDQMKTVFPGEVFFANVKEEWGSQNPQHRLEIRKSILEYLKQNNPDEVEDSIWNLGAPPVLKTLFVSISHCDGLGGFVVSSKPVGFDIEITSRLKSKLIERISTPEERLAAPNLEILWPAKEAVFKCDNRYATITQIHLNQWEPSQDESYRFHVLEIEGWAQKGLDFTYALAVKKG